MIKAHHHIHKGSRKCHVFSDESELELTEWASQNHISKSWIQYKKLPHLDLFGRMLVLAEELPRATARDLHQIIKKYEKEKMDKVMEKQNELL